MLTAMMILYALNCPAAEPLEVITPGHKAKLTHQVINENSLLVSVKDEQNNPIKGLTPADFIIKSGGSRLSFWKAAHLFRLILCWWWIIPIP